MLGIYLGDGYIPPPPYAPQLQIYFDTAQVGVIEECRQALALTFPGNLIGAYKRPNANCLRLSLTAPEVDAAFPHGGIGKKHERSIELTGWQREITARHPKALLRGLIHSDGCRVENRFRTTLRSGRVAEYAYPRYFFTNLSADIRGIFCEHCELVGVRWTQSNARNISVSHRDSVAILDSFIGPKT